MEKIKLAISFKGKTVGEGPIVVGLSNLDLSNAEIAEAIIADPQHSEDTTGMEQTNRKIFPVWVIPAGLAAESEIQMLRTIPYPWREVMEGSGLKFWAFNADGNTLTTGTEITISGVIVGRWLRD